MLAEAWKDIPGYEELYEVSNKGRVRTKKGKVTYRTVNGKEQKRIWKSRVLKEKNPNGRDVRVSLWKDKEEVSFLVHRLVATAFIPNWDNKPCINHIDGNPRNNHLSNLEWATYEENENHSLDNDLANTNIKVVLVCINTGGVSLYRSMAKASESIGRSLGYISNRLKQGKQNMESLDGKKYEVYLPANKIAEEG